MLWALLCSACDVAVWQTHVRRTFLYPRLIGVGAGVPWLRRTTRTAHSKWPDGRLQPLILSLIAAFLYEFAVRLHARFEVIRPFPLLLVAHIHRQAEREDQPAQQKSEHSANVLSLERLLP